MMAARIRSKEAVADRNGERWPARLAANEGNDWQIDREAQGSNANLRPPSGSPSRRLSRPDCRSVLTLIVALRPIGDWRTRWCPGALRTRRRVTEKAFSYLLVGSGNPTKRTTDSPRTPWSLCEGGASLAPVGLGLGPARNTRRAGPLVGGHSHCQPTGLF
jgi:hypothetical protein